MPDLEALEAALLRALRRYLAPELASRAVRDAIKALDVPEPPREEFTEQERQQARAALLRVGKIRKVSP